MHVGATQGWYSMHCQLGSASIMTLCRTIRIFDHSSSKTSGQSLPTIALPLYYDETICRDIESFRTSTLGKYLALYSHELKKS